MQRAIRKDILAVGVPKLANGTASLFIRIYTLRFLDPSGYGALSLGLSCVMLYDALVGTALDLATMSLITRSGECHSARIQPSEKAAIRLKLLVCLVLAALFSIGGERLGYLLLHGPGGRRFFLVLTAAGTGILLLRSMQLYFQARLRFPAFGAIDLAHSALRVLLAGAVLYSGAASANRILACFALAPALVVLIGFVYGKRAAAWNDIRTAWPDAREVFRKSVPIFASFGAGTAVSRLDLFLVAMRGTPAGLGLYAAASTLAGIPEVLGAYLAPVFLPRILPACRRGEFSRWFWQFHSIVFVGAGLFLAGFYIAGPRIMPALLPAKYTASIGLVQILLPGMLAAATFFPLTLNFLMLTRPRTFLIVDGVAAPVLAACYYFLVPGHGPAAAAWITSVHRSAKAAVIQIRASMLARHPAQHNPEITPAAIV